MKKFGNVLWGIVLIIIGLIIGGNALGITDINIFFDGWWTMFIIIPCFIGLFKEEDKIGKNFYKCHKNFLVNINNIVDVDKEKRIIKMVITIKTIQHDIFLKSAIIFFIISGIPPTTNPRIVKTTTRGKAL